MAKRAARPRLGRAWSEVSRVGTTWPTLRAMPCQPTGRTHSPGMAQHDSGCAGPAQRHGSLWFSQNKSIFGPSTLWARSIWLENKSILYSSPLWVLSDMVHQVYFASLHFFYSVVSCRASPPCRGCGRGTARLSSRAGTGMTPSQAVSCLGGPQASSHMAIYI